MRAFQMRFWYCRMVEVGAAISFSPCGKILIFCDNDFQIGSDIDGCNRSFYFRFMVSLWSFAGAPSLAVLLQCTRGCWIWTLNLRSIAWHRMMCSSWQAFWYQPLTSLRANSGRDVGPNGFLFYFKGLWVRLIYSGDLIEHVLRI